jgi:hypothetical protein
MLDVQLGLHCLTGGDAREEKAFRADVATSLVGGGWLDRDWALGLALHAYGDSFAHVRLDDTTRMYDWGFGHAVEGWENDRWHAPDNLGRAERRDSYVTYGRGLYDILSKRSSGKPATMKPDELEARLRTITRSLGEFDQAATLFVFAEALGHPPDKIWLQDVPKTSFTTFDEHYLHDGAGMAERIRSLAASWRTQRQQAAIGIRPMRSAKSPDEAKKAINREA